MLPNTGTAEIRELKAAITLPEKPIVEFCNRWKIAEFYLFGSILRDDFHAESDVDTMIHLAPNAQVGLFELAAMKRELEALFSRKVDIMTKNSIEASSNPIRRKEILRTARLVYAAR